MNKDKESVLKRFLETIFEISDKEYQKRIWLKGLGPECSSFEEAICYYFDDEEYIKKNYKFYNISHEQWQKITLLNAKLKKICDKVSIIVNEEEILSDPQWNEIRKIAKETLKAFNYKKK